MAVMCLAFAGAVITFIAVIILGSALAEKHILSEEAVTARLNKEITSFREYVAQNQLTSTDVNAVSQWNREHERVQITVYGLKTIISASHNGAELIANDGGFVVPDSGRDGEGMEFPVNFRDGVFSVAVYDNVQNAISTGLTLAALLLAAIVFLSTVLLYDQHITRTVQTLSRQVRQMSRGDLQMQILPQTSDEIGQLALDVDAMRLSIIDKLHREEAAWQANSQLITAISHDVRTPLTALLGYLEVLSDEGLSPDERRAYLEVCKNNAGRLKSLTDELFGFFLVFGRPNPDQMLEEFDAVTLLDQIMLEHMMILSQQSFDVELRTVGELSGKLKVDLGHMRRIFDNLFSNVSKYADRSKPVIIVQKVVEGELQITLTNFVASQSPRAESNRIGLQTCQKLLQAMGGEFGQSRTKDTFTVDVILPLYQE